VENLLHFYLADFPVASQITAVTLTAIPKIRLYFNFAILFKSRKFDAREIYTVSRKKGSIELFMITLSNLNRFSKFLHC